MKKSISIVVLVALVAGLLLALVGCGGGDKKQAQEYMKTADELQSEVEDSLVDLQSEMTNAFENVADVESYKAAIANVKEITAELNDKAQEAIDAYKKIEGLNGVDDYKNYAALKIEAGEIFQTMLKTTDEFLDNMEQAVVSGTLTDASGQSMLAEFEGEMSDLSDKMEEADQKADDLKADKGL